MQDSMVEQSEKANNYFINSDEMVERCKRLTNKLCQIGGQRERVEDEVTVSPTLFQELSLIYQLNHVFTSCSSIVETHQLVNKGFADSLGRIIEICESLLVEGGPFCWLSLTLLGYLAFTDRGLTEIVELGTLTTVAGLCPAAARCGDGEALRRAAALLRAAAGAAAAAGGAASRGLLNSCCLALANLLSQKHQDYYYSEEGGSSSNLTEQQGASGGHPQQKQTTTEADHHVLPSVVDHQIMEEEEEDSKTGGGGGGGRLLELENMQYEYVMLTAQLFQRHSSCYSYHDLAGPTTETTIAPKQTDNIEERREKSKRFSSLPLMLKKSVALKLHKNISEFVKQHQQHHSDSSFSSHADEEQSTRRLKASEVDRKIRLIILPSLELCLINNNQS